MYRTRKKACILICLIPVSLLVVILQVVNLSNNDKHNVDSTIQYPPPMPHLMEALKDVPPRPPYSATATTNMTNIAEPILITYATWKGEFFFCETVHSALQAGWQVYVLGYGIFPGDGDQNKFLKLPTLLEFLKRLPPSQLFVFMDGYDVLVQGGPVETRSKFLAQQSDIIFGSEPNCWPFVKALDRPDTTWLYAPLCHEAYPPQKYRWRFLNSGVWMGYAQSGMALLEGLLRISQIPHLYLKEDDQACAAYAFLSQKFGIALDTQNELFQSAYMSEDALEYSASTRRWKNNVTHSHPITIHFNGDKTPYNMFARGIYGVATEEERIQFVTQERNPNVLSRLHGMDYEGVCEWNQFYEFKKKGNKHHG